MKRSSTVARQYVPIVDGALTVNTVVRFVGKRIPLYDAFQTNETLTGFGV